MRKVSPLSVADRFRALLRRIAYGGRADSRLRRYLWTAAAGIVLVWALSVAYLKLAPLTYTSTVVLVLPGTGAGASVNLENLGSATSNAASAYSSPDLSPTENYRKILLSHRLLTAAAEAAGEEPERFPTPKVELADQTKLISISITGRSPAQASARAEAMRSVFETLLDTLRKDELKHRDESYQATLAGYRARLQEARDRLIAQQAQSGLVSVSEYGTIVANVEHLREQMRDTQIKLAQQRQTAEELTRLLETSPSLAAAAMVLHNDPIFQALLDTLAKQESDLAVQRGIHGTANPKLIDTQAERDSVLGQLMNRAATLAGVRRGDVLKLRDLSLRDERGQLFGRLLNAVADAGALARMQDALAGQIADEQQRVLRLAPAASRLENLSRDVQVAEAVFSSALARTDTSKSDYFASYPMVQTFEPPLTPGRPSSPQPVLAVGGGIGATFLILAALVLSWLRIALLQKILKRS